MGTLFISLLTLVLLLISAFVVLIVLMQRTSQSGGMGAALGGGAAESAFGSETNSILMKGTIYGIVAFFLVALGLYLLYQAEAAENMKEVDAASLITAGETDDSAETVTGVIDDAVEEGTESGAAESITIEGEASEANVDGAVETSGADATGASPATN
ncbi:MAG TPA: preprotein translocase subunit SecG [Opitutales bacterium]|nr:preprotein translocase subunit SecG [Opitutales bacterium]